MIRGESGNSTIEYLLMVSGVGVASAGAFTAGLKFILPQLLGRLCLAIDSASSAAATIGSCLGH